MNVEEIKELIQIVIDSGVAELEVQRGEDRVRIRRSGVAPAAQEIVIPHTVQMPVQPSPYPSAMSPTNPGTGAAMAIEQHADAKSVTVRAPIVGTFYDAPSPGASPFVKVGDTVRAGQVLCIIESMKLMNEIEAEVAGAITAKLVENGNPIEYGEALFTIRPL